MQAYKVSTIDFMDMDKLNDFLEEQSIKFPYSDIFEHNEPFELKEHFHTDYESRFIITGNPTFTINGEEIQLTKGMYIELKPNILHSFKSNGPVKALRFFKTPEGWQDNYND
mgnify:CR=1 FL=1